MEYRQQAMNWWKGLTPLQQLRFANEWQKSITDSRKSWSYLLIVNSSRCIEDIYVFSEGVEEQSEPQIPQTQFKCFSIFLSWLPVIGIMFHFWDMGFQQAQGKKTTTTYNLILDIYHGICIAIWIAWLKRH